MNIGDKFNLTQIAKNCIGHVGELTTKAITSIERGGWFTLTGSKLSYFIEGDEIQGVNSNGNYSKRYKIVK